MATKTFDELKQLAIQIRDEKTNKQNTANRVGTAMLEGINKLEQDYYDKTAADKELKKRDDKLIELANNVGLYNVDKHVPLGGGFYTSATARAAVPSDVRKIGLIITYKTDATTSVTEQFIGSDVSGWTTDANWKNVGSEGGNKILEWKTDAATTRKKVPVKERKAGMQISYKPTDSDWVNEQYVGTSFTDTEWVKDSNWEKIPKQKQLTELENEIKTIGRLEPIGAQTYEVGNTITHEYKLPNFIVGEKITFILSAENIQLGIKTISIKLNNKALYSGTDFDLSTGLIIEKTPSTEDLANNNEGNKLTVQLSNVQSEGDLDLYLLYSSETDLNNLKIGNDTFIKANVVDMVLKEEDFGNKAGANLTTGAITPTSNNNRCTTFKKLGTTKDVLMGASSSAYSIVAYDKNKTWKYFIFNSVDNTSPKYYKFTEDIEYIVINGGSSENKCPLGTIIYNVPVEYVWDNISPLQKLEACPYKVFTYDEFFNTKSINVATFASEPSASTANDARIKLDVRGYIGIQSSNRALNPIYEYDANGNCVAAYSYQSNSDNWYARGAIKFHPETAYITVVCSNKYKTNIVLYKKPSRRNFISAIDNEKYSRNSRLTEWKVFGDSTSDEGWAGTEVDYWTMASRLLGLQAENMAKAASSFLPFIDGSVAGAANTSIYEKTKLLSDFNGLITMLGGTNDYNGGWNGSVWGPANTENRASKLMIIQENGRELFKKLSVKKFEELLTIEELLADHNNHYFEEAFLYIMWDLKIRNPKALIICISPFGRIGEEYPNVVGATLQDYRNAEKRICQLLGIPFIDIQDVVGGINYNFYFNRAESETSVAEGLHPNVDGHKISGAWLTVKLREYIDMWELLNNGYIDTAYGQGKNTTGKSNKMFEKETFELNSFVK